MSIYHSASKICALHICTVRGQWGNADKHFCKDDKLKNLTIFLVSSKRNRFEAKDPLEKTSKQLCKHLLVVLLHEVQFAKPWKVNLGKAPVTSESRNLPVRNPKHQKSECGFKRLSIRESSWISDALSSFHTP